MGTCILYSTSRWLLFSHRRMHTKRWWASWARSIHQLTSLYSIRESPTSSGRDLIQVSAICIYTHNIYRPYSYISSFSSSLFFPCVHWCIICRLAKLYISRACHCIYGKRRQSRSYLFIAPLVSYLPFLVFLIPIIFIILFLPFPEFYISFHTGASLYSEHEPLYTTT